MAVVDTMYEMVLEAQQVEEKERLAQQLRDSLKG